MAESSSDGVGDAEDLRFFFDVGLGEESGDGDDFCFFFGEADASGSDSSLDFERLEPLFFAEGDGDFSGVGDGLAAGSFSSSFFFCVVELLRCFRGAGVGVGAKIFLILSPNDCSALALSGAPITAPIKTKMHAIPLARLMAMGK